MLYYYRLFLCLSGQKKRFSNFQVITFSIYDCLNLKLDDSGRRTPTTPNDVKCLSKADTTEEGLHGECTIYDLCITVSVHSPFGIQFVRQLLSMLLVLAGKMDDQIRCLYINSIVTAK